MRKTSKCPVHGSPLLSGRAPVHSSFADNDIEYRRASSEQFPCSRAFVPPLCCGDHEEPTSHPVEYCLECRRAEKSWFLERPIVLSYKVWEREELVGEAVRRCLPELLFSDGEVEERAQQVREEIADMKRRGVEPEEPSSPVVQREWEVRVCGLGGDRPRALMGLRSVLDLGLDEVQAFAASVPRVVWTGTDSNVASWITRQLRAAGLVVESVELPREKESDC